MKKFLAILLMLTMVFTMAACGGDTGADNSGDEVQNGAQNEDVNLDVLTETDQIVLHLGDGERQAGEEINLGQFGELIEVWYGGEMVTGYSMHADGESCISATMWEEHNFRLDAVKNGSCELVIVYGEEKATFPVVVEDLPEMITLNWIGYIVQPAEVTGDGIFGTPGLDDDIIVMFNGEPIADYTWTIGDESLAEVTQNADGSLHIKALKEGEVLEFLTIEYNGMTAVFGLCV
jgi:hypothetical protein